MLVFDFKYFCVESDGEGYLCSLGVGRAVTEGVCIRRGVGGYGG